MAETAIEWTDATWNPVTGCSKVSPGCGHCYAERIELRFGRSTKPWTPENAAENVRLHPERLEQPLKWRKPRMVFVNSMSDLFHELIPIEFIGEVFRVMADCPQHTFQVLTKRPDRMRSCLLWLDDAANELPNVWFGTSIENRQFVHRADLLRETPAAVRFISAEPLLGPLLYDAGDMGMDEWAEYSNWTDDFEGPELDLYNIDWLTRATLAADDHRPMRPEWVRALRDQATSEGSAFFFKQWGGATPKAGGRLLDGREWNEMPKLQTGSLS